MTTYYYEPQPSCSFYETQPSYAYNHGRNEAQPSFWYYIPVRNEAQPSTNYYGAVSNETQPSTSSDGNPVSAQPSSSNSSPVSAQPSSSYINPVSAQPSSSYRNPVSAQPSSSYINTVSAQLSSSSSNPVSAQPSSSSSNPVTHRGRVSTYYYRTVRNQTPPSNTTQDNSVGNKTPPASYYYHSAGYLSRSSIPHTRSFTTPRVPTASSPANTSSSSSSNTGSQSGTLSTSLSNNMGGQGGEQQLSKTNLYIHGLNPATTDKELYNMCSQFGTIISTKAILDKNTNKCKGYGFVDFESGDCAEAAVKALQGKGIQAQMAKVGITLLRSPTTQQEQDPTNLYIANLPLNYKETDLENLLLKYGHVISTRILKDTTGTSKGVGFARMESKDKCEQIIQAFNGKPLPGCKDALLVKFADGGQKKRNVYRNDSRMWREGTDSGQMGYDGSSQNGVATQHMLPATLTGYGSYQTQVSSYPLPTSWTHSMLPAQYTVMQPTPHMSGVEMMQSADPNAVQYAPVIRQLSAHMNTLQISPAPPYIAAPATPYSYYGHAPSIIHTMPIPENEHNSNTASPDDTYQYQPQPQK